MNSITIKIPDEDLEKLQATANRLGVSIEELVLMGVENLLKQSDASFQDAMDYLLKKNTELYKRLA
ncbi:ribbon-helix-helix protein, CopG family [Fischerella sp. JS2]|uniref:ribbon-helix-helix protein, CopG family n=1 Tax=Fischerella sp. JS2 TaxID=2597771 RepID=UPI0028EE7B84|nr:ribbon-helix-helix protein, CopG family [Fischerella sp. JS2]